MWVATTLVLVALAPAQKNEAEELFKKMEDKVHKAKTVEFESESVLEGTKKGTVGVKVAVAEGNKAKFTVNIDAEGQKQTMEAIADGSKTVHIREGKRDVPKDTPKNMAAGFAVITTRMGIAVLSIRKEGEDHFKADKFDKDKFIPLSDFKLGKKEKIGDKEAQAVEYLIALEGQDGEKFPVTVWIDTKTNLPVKRVMVVMKQGTTTTVTETIKNYKVDEKIDPKTFELPKD